MLTRDLFAVANLLHRASAALALTARYCYIISVSLSGTLNECTYRHTFYSLIGSSLSFPHFTKF